MTEPIPRAEYPRPQFERKEWINLNGFWTFAFDFGKSGVNRGFALSTGFDRDIRVPFCPESTLSGVGYTDFIECMWYHRLLQIPDSWAGKRILLHFGAVDFECDVYIDGLLAGRHWGGSASFCFDITSRIVPGQESHLVVHVRDELRSGLQPGGKQSPQFHSQGCLYSRVTGIWQTVWIEAVSPCALEQCRIMPDYDGSAFMLIPRYRTIRKGMRFRAVIKDNNRIVGQVEGPAVQGLPCRLAVESPKSWSPVHPFLYTMTMEIVDGNGDILDTVGSYAGLRKIHIEGDRLFLNNEPLYLRLVLDQGFYPNGLWTAPSDAALKHDIELSQRAGFNGARLHQKVFEERFHYWADRSGYLTWGESASWGMDIDSKIDLCARNFLCEWREIVVRDRNHPSIIAWTPLNETAYARVPLELQARFTRDSVALTREADPTRPVNDASGYIHIQTDLWTVHHYAQDPAALKNELTPDPALGVWTWGRAARSEREAEYEGQPYLVDEFGGIRWVMEGHQWDETSWGYGEGPKTLDEFYARLEGLVQAVLNLPHINGYCYTQLTDVEQEQNGIYNYDRSDKFDMDRIASIFAKSPCSA